MPELDRLPGRTRVAPELIRQTGPLSGPAPPRSGDASGPVLVSLSTISYPGQREVLRRIVTAVGTLTVPTAPSALSGVVAGSALSGVSVRQRDSARWATTLLSWSA